MKRLLTAHCSLLTLFLAALVSVSAAPARATSVSATAHCSLLTANFVMPNTIRQQIVDEFKTRLAAIDSTADPLVNGYQYQTDIGQNAVERWRTNYNETELKDATGKARLSVFDLVRTREKEYPDQAGVVAILPVQVRIFHYRDDIGPEELTKMLADVQQAVVTNPDTGARDLQLGGLAIDIRPGDDGFIIPNEVFTLEGGAVGFNVEHLIDPYGQ